jgi:3-oxoacyl-[acyl-carrier protein] reductase
LKSIVITGASQGIGFELAQLLAEQHKVIVITRSKKSNAALLKKGVLVLNADIVSIKQTDIDAFLKLNNISKIDILINNAGLLVNKPFQKITYKDYQKVFDVNFYGAFNMSQLLYKYMLKSKLPHIVNISSVGGVNNTSKFPGLSIYSSSKGALTTLSECLAEELKGKISVNTLALGAVDTEMLQQAFPGYKAPLSSYEVAKYVADFALFGNNFMNGQIIKVALSNP